MRSAVKKCTYQELVNQLLNKKVNFKSECQFFPNFDVTGVVYDIQIRNNEYLIMLHYKNGKTYTIGSNMHNLTFEII